MCGILFIAYAAGDLPEASGSASDCYPDAAPFLQGLANRGPDQIGIKTIHIDGGGNDNGKDPNLCLTFAGSILQLRGHDPVSSPLIDPNFGNILLWNGEIFNENKEKHENILNVPTASNDAKALLHTLTTTDDIPAVFSSIRGPWACVFWHAETRTLWFGRDVLGRRSLLAKWPSPISKKIKSNSTDTDSDNGSLCNHLVGGVPDTSFILTSVVPLDSDKSAEGYVEVEPGLYKIQLKNHRLEEKEFNFFCTGDGGGSSSNMEKFDIDDGSVASIEDRVARLKLLNEGLMTAVDWQDEEIRAIKAFHRPEHYIEPSMEENAEEDDGKLETDEKEEGKMGTAAAAAAAAINAAAVKGVLTALRAAVRHQQHQHQQQQLNDQAKTVFSNIKPAKLMILFSGGVDSTILSALAHEYLPPDEPIDLVSICFAQGTSPDREAALNAFEELKHIAPNRPWRLIGADKILEDVENARDRLRKLLYPSDTVMDLNIGAAIWLAAAGEGTILSLGGDRHRCAAHCTNNNLHLGEVGMTYRSAARCVFLGHGADELFGGYGRHRTRFRNAGWQGLSEELALDVKRLWVRNLGRDDRLVADRGREARHPFLDERVILQALRYHPLSSLTDLRMALGVGDKLVLREILRQLGLPEAAARVKRAIQFGTRLAKVTNIAQFGGTRQANAKNAGSVRLIDVRPLPAAGNSL
ncbi:hypothetical protein Ndes2437A_g07347 [Nannochloris sp. 'desiccata']